ncbi:serine/threonine protein kinase [Salinibacterium sp. UTAS2018]|uniref:protein kinase domain-containing protein n=1 Tax=Salinibacterium sp. UTAS2018 TaxID=2508880 RepID=UPI0010096772|nr:protein kinase [Salinibacterium sp. UTAS2018]QAV70684.1 serine/threonine protein kinase [Salinibacterium sp. UTAS2018]
MRPTSGLTFGGRYQLSSRVAIGGMGEVWEATDLVIGRTVAIKILKDEYLGDPGFLERFRAEARHAALVNHEGIANVFDYGEEDGSAYLVMELVPGEALSAILERERVLDPDRVLDMVAQTAAALQAAHAAGLVHRDIKPGNLLITPEGRVKITDFGIARIADQVPLTATGQVMGTVQYLSPEQASGHPASPTTDIYSLGIVAYEALAGRRPFTGESQVAIAMAQINETPPELPITVAEPVRNLVYACLAKSPGDRPSSASHLSRAAQSLRRGDIAAAAAAVPGIMGDNSHAATVGLNYGNSTQATRVLNTASAPGEAPTAAEIAAESKPRNPWTWPIVALISLLAVVLIGAIIALLASPGEEEAPPTSASPTVSVAPEPAPSTSAPPTKVSLTEDELLNRTRDAVEQLLEEKGLLLDAQTGSEAPTSNDVGRSYSAAPVGNVAIGETITVRFYDEIPETPTAPQPQANLLEPAGPYNPGDTVTVKWNTYSDCPAGHALSSYNFLVQGGPSAGPSEYDKDATSFDIILGEDSTVETKISYSVTCDGLVASPMSEQVIVTVTDPAP